MSVTVSVIPGLDDEPADLLVEVGAQHLALSVDDARKLRDALCVMVGLPKGLAKKGKPNPTAIRERVKALEQQVADLTAELAQSEFVANELAKERERLEGELSGVE